MPINHNSKFNLIFYDWESLGGASPISYLLLDEFITDENVPLATPRISEPGPATLTIVDTNNVMSIAGGRFIMNGALAANDRLISTLSYAHAGGRAFGMVIPVRTTVGVNLVGGVASATTGLATLIGIRFVSASALRVTEGTNTVISSYTLGANEWCIVGIMRPSGGGFLFVRNGLTGNYKLLFVYNRLALAGYLRLSAGNGALTANLETDNWVVCDLSDQLASDFGIATNHIAAPTNGQTTTQTANGTIELTWTVAGGETLVIRFRRTDDDNCLRLECNQAAGTIRLYARVAGIDTELNAGQTQTWTAGNAYRVMIFCEGTTLLTFVQAPATAPVPKHSATSSANQTETGVAATGFASAANLATWPLEVALPAPFDNLAYLLPETSTLQRVSRQILWSSVAEPNWLARPVILDNDGTWIAAYMQINTHNPSTDAQIHLRFSQDEGETWTDPNTFTDGNSVVGAPFNETVATKALVECVLFRCPNGDLILHSFERPGGGTSQWRSTNDGASWTHEGIINSDTTMVASDDYVVVGSNIYLVVRIDPGSDFVHPHYLACYTSTDNAATWTLQGNIEAVLDCNEAGIMHISDTTLCVIGKDTLNLSTFRYISNDFGETWLAREYITNQLGIMNKPRCKHLGGYHWVYGRDVHNTTKTVVYRSLDGLDWEGRFYPDSDDYEDTGYCDMLQRSNGDFYMLSYNGTAEQASVVEYVFRNTD